MTRNNQHFNKTTPATAPMNWRPTPTALGVAVALATLAPVVHADELNIAQQPLFLSGGAPANVMFVIDDSGSMHWEVMPDDLIWSYFMYPRPDNVYSDDNYPNWVVTFDEGPDDWAYAAYLRTHEFNATYYNPSITYRPWVDADGVEFPQADPAAALHNPARPAVGNRDLTSDNTQTADWDNCETTPFNGTNCTFDTDETRTFWPALYYSYHGGHGDEEEWDLSNFTRVEIRPAQAEYSGDGRENRSDCAQADDGVCTYDEEIQNFANWYTYHRSRILTSRGGIGRAFAEQGDNIRVGYGSINTENREVDDVTSGWAVRRGVRGFGGDDRDDFFDRLYNQPIPTAGTPLRRALQGAGEYYERDDDRGPWSSTPGAAGGDPNGQLECRQSYTVLMTDGFWNGPSPGVGNADNSTGPTITGPDGQSFQYQPEAPYRDGHNNTLADVAMDFWYRDLRPDLENRVPVTPGINEAFWQHMVTFGVGLGVTGTLDPETDLPDLESGDEDWPNPTAGNDEKIDDLWHASLNSRGDFLSATDPDTFADEMSTILRSLVARTEGSAAAVAANTTEAASDTLLYQARFNSAGWSGDIAAFEIADDGSVDENNPVWQASDRVPQPNNRRAYARDVSGSINSASDFSDERELVFTGADVVGGDVTADDLLEYLLLGDDSNEVRNGGDFRNRPDTVLGDIVNSSPFVTRGSNFGYSILPGNEGDNYPEFLDKKRDWPEMLYVGANDGMMHAIDASADGGNVVFSFVPDVVFDDLPKLADPDYVHQFYVDGQVRVADAYFKNDWEKFLVGSTGAGARAVFGLTVSDPTNFGDGNIEFEITGDDHEGLGHVLGDLYIVKLNDDKWATVFGNGYNSDDQTAQLFIVPLEDPDDPVVINTNVGSSADPNGLGGITPADINGDGTTDIVYGGDLEGNLWRFDLSSDSRSDWGYSKLFQAVDSDTGQAQPITAAPEIARHSAPDVDINVLVGTGRFFVEGDNEVGSDPQVQSFYAIQDDGSGSTVARNNLLEQEILEEGVGDDGSPFRELSTNSLTDESGWRIDLVVDDQPDGERVVDQAVAVDDRVFFLSQIPEDNPCAFGGRSWLYEMDLESGAQTNLGTFDNVSEDAGSIGFDQLATGLSGLRGDGVLTFYPSLSDASIEDIETDLSPGLYGRQSWRELR